MINGLVVSSTVEIDTRRWVERVVIGLNLCPFAKSVHNKGQIHYAVTLADDAAGLLAELAAELEALAACDAEQRSTTLLVAPLAFCDFRDFNDFLALAEALVAEMKLDGILQIASFHPQFQFAGTSPDDITNATNRSPYPTLHLLREASVEAAIEALPGTESIYLRNIETLKSLGREGFTKLATGPSLQPSARAAGESK